MDNSTKIAWGITLCGVAAMWWLKKRENTQSYYSHYVADNYYNYMDEIKLPRGYRNNNPLNIDYYNRYGQVANNWQGQTGVEPEGRFAQFKTMPYGYRAALITLRTYIKKYGANTIAKMIGRWAPAAADNNNTDNYIRFVSNMTDINKDQIIDRNDADSLCKIVYAMTLFENGENDLTRQMGLPNMETIKLGWEII